MRHNPSATKTFAESLPTGYRSSFDWAAISEHASISQRRSPGHPAVGTFHASRLPGHALCIVADDRPGLLATISVALVGERLDVIAAEAYTRRLPNGGREAVDIFWVKQLTSPDEARPLSPELLGQLEASLDRLLTEHYEPGTARIPTQRPQANATIVETTVRFIEDRQGTLSTLEVEATDRTGLLLVLTRALYEQKVQIVSSSIRTEGGQVRDRFEITELDESPIRPERRLLVQVAVLDAVQRSFGGS